MPIRDEKLQEPANRNHIALKGTATWGQAAALFKDRKGQGHWPLVVLKADGTYAAATFENLLKGDAPAETPLENLPGLAPVEAVDAASMSTGDAEAKANSIKTGVKLIVVVKSGKYAGIIYAGASRSDSALPTSKLDQLAGTNADLSQIGDLLLG